jgi:Ser/Thr protein kinase RdoA (MazF antagonist)
MLGTLSGAIQSRMTEPTTILERYGVHNATLEALGDTQNVNHRVLAQDGTHFLLRCHRVATHSTAMLESELIWLEYLSAAKFDVQRPQRTLEGQLILELGGERYSLLSWLEGDTLELLNAVQAEQAGALMARLHTAALIFTPPPGFTRPRYDAAHLERTLETLRTLPWLESDIPLFERAATHASSAFADSSGWALVHADLHAGNVLWDGTRIKVIDFDACGFAPLGFDIATALGYLEDDERDTFLRGYESIRPLPEHFALERRRFTIAEWLTNLAFLAPRAVDRDYVENLMLPGLREQLPRMLEEPSA